MTASGFASARSEVLAAGLDDYVRKPYRSSEIFECMAHQLGVRYSRGGAATVPAGDPTMQLRPRELAALPEELREELRESLRTLDVRRICAAVESVAERDAALGAVLARCARRYAYTAMLNAIEQATDNQPVLPHDRQPGEPHGDRAA